MMVPCDDALALRNEASARFFFRPCPIGEVADSGRIEKTEADQKLMANGESLIRTLNDWTGGLLVVFIIGSGAGWAHSTSRISIVEQQVALVKKDVGYIRNEVDKLDARVVTKGEHDRVIADMMRRLSRLEQHL